MRPDPVNTLSQPCRPRRRTHAAGFAIALGLLVAHDLVATRRLAGADPQPQRNIVYAQRSGEDLQLDLVVPDGAGPFPLLLFIHGGGWREGSRENVWVAALDAAGKGYAAAAVSYLFAPKYAWPEQLEDVRAALKWLRSNAAKLKIDPDRVGAVGWSAGGQLSLFLGLTDPKTGADAAPVDAVVNYFGPTDMTKDVFNDTVDKLLYDLAGGSREEKGAVYKDFSAVSHVAAGCAPVMTFHGTTDELVPVEQARILHKALDAAKVPNRLEILEGKGHGWEGLDMEHTKLAGFEFLDMYLKGPELPLLAVEDFAVDAEHWVPTEPDAWKAGAVGGRPAYVLGKPATPYEPKVRSPVHYSLLRGEGLSNFVLEVEALSTAKEYDHRDVCIIFGWQDPEHFYYAHLAKAADPNAHSIFLVDGKPRVSIAKERTAGVEWRDAWHRLRVQRDAASGKIEVYFDDLSKPILQATDKTFRSGRVGLGSFDDTGAFRKFRLFGKRPDK